MRWREAYRLGVLRQREGRARAVGNYRLSGDAAVRLAHHAMELKIGVMAGQACARAVDDFTALPRCSNKASGLFTPLRCAAGTVFTSTLICKGINILARKLH